LTGNTPIDVALSLNVIFPARAAVDETTAMSVTGYPRIVCFFPRRSVSIAL
jgi:hypothetical protein